MTDNKKPIEFWLQSIMNEHVENQKLKEALSYLPKVPTQPYEKEMAKKILSLESRITRLREALNFYADMHFTREADMHWFEDRGLIARQALANNDYEKCKDPFHSTDSVSNKVYDKCPSCEFKKQDLIDAIKELDGKAARNKDEI